MQRAFKCILLGDSNTGKSTLLQSLFPSEAPIGPTIGIDFRFFDVDPQRRIVLWDTSGMNRFRCITRAYYHDNDIVIFVFNVSNRASFSNIKDWMEDYEQSGRLSQYYLFANRYENGNEKRCVTQREAETFAHEHNMIYIEDNASTARDIWVQLKTLVQSKPIPSQPIAAPVSPPKPLSPQRSKPTCLSWLTIEI